MKRVIHLAILGVPLAIVPNAAHAYIDPGLLSVVVQGFFALLFGSAAAYLLAPWRRLKALFGIKSPETADPDADAAIADMEDGSNEARR
jgi:hypothetical protein